VTYNPDFKVTII